MFTFRDSEEGTAGAIRLQPVHLTYARTEEVVLEPRLEALGIRDIQLKKWSVRFTRSGAKM